MPTLPSVTYLLGMSESGPIRAKGLRKFSRTLRRSILSFVGLAFALPGSGRGALDGQPPDPAEPLRTNGTRVVDPRPVAGYDWLQFNRDAQHAGNNALEWRITRANVSSLQKLFRVAMFDIADGAPVYLSRVSTPLGIRDLLFTTTTVGFLVAHDACTGSRAWLHEPPTGPHWTTSSPAIDPDRQYVYGYQLDGFVHRFRVGDGTEVTGGGWPQLVTKKPDVEKGSSDLSIVTNREGRRLLYATSAGYPGDPGDQGDYQGHVTAIDLSAGSQTVFNTLCSDRSIHFDESLAAPNDCGYVRSGVWGRAGVAYDPETDHVLFATGNGDFGAKEGSHNWGGSVLALAPDLSVTGGMPLDSYTPSNYQQLADDDLDLGSSTPLVLPGAGSGRMRLAVQVGKDGQLRLLNASDLSGQGGPAHLGGELQILPVPQGGEVLTAPAAWVSPVDASVWLFVANDEGISGLRLESAGDFRLAVQWQSARGGTSPIVANGVLFYAGNGFLAALKPETGEELWSDHDIGKLHWQSPIVVNGVLYLADNGPALNAYAPGGVSPARADGPCH